MSLVFGLVSHFDHKLQMHNYRLLVPNGFLQYLHNKQVVLNFKQVVKKDFWTYLCFVPFPQVAEHDVHSPSRHSLVLRGHSSVLHRIVSILFSAHVPLLPSNCAKQDSFRVDTPPPHGFEHGVHGVYVVTGSEPDSVCVCVCFIMLQSWRLIQM